MSNSTVTNVIPIDLTANRLGEIPSSVAGDNPLAKYGYIAPAGATMLLGTNIVTRRARPRYGVGAEVINPSTGEVIPMGVSTTHDFNTSVADEAVGKAKMLECLKAHRAQVAAQTDAELQTYVDAVYAWSRDIGNVSKQTAMDVAYKAILGIV